ncbi:MAG: hypothetical protein EOP48_21400 [Sphingobacteriales bacterium]|nr:MAG: hypothetical protein EOP48_21400 [Sphingobacteriales bacterium]
MDVLQLLKAEFRSRKAELANLSQTAQNSKEKSAILSRLNVHLAWESEFLLPELSVIATHGDALVEKYQQSLKRLQSLCLEKSQDGAELLEAFERHIDIVEEKILPFMRQKIPTVDREELYHVFIDAQQELLKSRSVEFAI